MTQYGDVSSFTALLIVIFTLSLSLARVHHFHFLHFTSVEVWETLDSVEVRSSRMTWSSVEVSWFCCRRLNIHAQAACVVEQAWILYKRRSIGEDKPRLRLVMSVSRSRRYMVEKV